MSEDNTRLDVFPNRRSSTRDTSTKNIVWALRDVDNDVQKKLDDYLTNGKVKCLIN